MFSSNDGILGSNKEQGVGWFREEHCGYFSFSSSLVFWKPEGPWEVLSIAFMGVLLFKSHSTVANSSLQSTYLQGFQTPISRRWNLLAGFPLPLFLGYPVERVLFMSISPGELSRLVSSTEPNTVVEYYKVICWTVTMFFKLPITFTLDRSNLVKSWCNIHMVCRNLHICLAIKTWFIFHLSSSGVWVWLMPPVHSRTAVLPLPPKLSQWHHMEMMHLVMLHEAFRILEDSVSVRNPHSAYKVDRRVALLLEVQIPNPLLF